jgi:exopolysaccharide biosynthesis WecB/TagA/CpsF family protein
VNLMVNFAAPASRRRIFDLPVCDLGWEDALSFIGRLASLPTGITTVAFANAHNMLVMLRDENYREVLMQTLVLPDGIGLDIASRVAHGSAFPANLNGTDFVPALLTFMERPMRVGLIGGRPGVVERAAENFRGHAPWHDFVVISDGYFGDAGSDAVVAETARQKLDILIVGMGTPTQEKWVAEHIRTEHARLVLTVGALFDFVSGTVPRAPRFVRALRIEWLYRLMLEPARLWRRYVIGVPLFLREVARHRAGRRSHATERKESPAPPSTDRRAS